MIVNFIVWDLGKIQRRSLMMSQRPLLERIKKGGGGRRIYFFSTTFSFSRGRRAGIAPFFVLAIWVS